MTTPCTATVGGLGKTFGCQLQHGHPGPHTRALGRPLDDPASIRLTWISEVTRTSTAIISRAPSNEALRR